MDWSWRGLQKTRRRVQIAAALPLLLVNQSLWALAGPLLLWKTSLLPGFTAASFATYRPFCRTLCPLGAAYGLFNGIAVFRLHTAPSRCDQSGACSRVCPAGLDLRRQIHSPRMRALPGVQPCVLPIGGLARGFR